MSELKNTEEGVDNTNAVVNITETGDLHEVAMILGSREHIKPAGVIRPGIKIPLGNCSQAQKDLYARMLDDGHGFSDIDTAMLKIADKSYTKKTCLRPSNSDCFTIRDEEAHAVNAVWSYERPKADVGEIAGHLAFYPSHVEIVRG